MRQRHTTQGSIFWFRPEHQISRYLDKIDQWLNQSTALLSWVDHDLNGSTTFGRPGMSCDQILRAALILQYRRCSYRELEFLLKDSMSFQSFCRIDPCRPPSKSTLRDNISAIRPATWRKMNRHFICTMNNLGIETGQQLRIDSTVTETNILFPTDSKLLYNSIRLMVRVLKKLKSFVDVKYVDHSRRAKRHWFAATMARNDERRYPHYKKLLDDVEQTRLVLYEVLEALKKQGDQPNYVEEIQQLLTLVAKVMSQTTRRVVCEEQVPVEDKIVSLHEAHTDIIVKGGRDVQFGHKINLTTGTSGLVIDVTIERGNPSDKIRLLPLLRRHKRLFGEAPKRIAADGGYASAENLAQAKLLGVESVAFDKRINLSIKEMTGSDWLYRELKRFRAGIEASISYLKRCFGLGRVVWKGWRNYQSSVYLSVFTHNLIVWARSG
ncbi:MAG: ISNCY family transposase [Pseudomonadales bacterium]|nr:ISNCY family transposase [Pseudomonadales bacterium]